MKPARRGGRAPARIEPGAGPLCPRFEADVEVNRARVDVRAAHNLARDPSLREIGVYLDQLLWRTVGVSWRLQLNSIEGLEPDAQIHAVRLAASGPRELKELFPEPWALSG